VVRNLMRIEAW